MKKLIAGCMTAALTMVASSSLAVAHNPTGEYARFANCPLSRATITDCLYHVMNGSLTVGKKTVPLVNPITFQGGFEGEGSEISFFGAEGADTLSKTPQPVPGGLFGIDPPASWPKSAQQKFNNAIDNGATGVKATIELAVPPTSIKMSTEAVLFEEGVAVSLPVKIKLDNRLLGDNCYIGSNSNPIKLELTAGPTSPPPPNQSIRGASGKLLFNEAFTITGLEGIRFVDNAFAVPKANGCGKLPLPFVDPLVNSLFGLPSAAGRNTIILQGTLQLGHAPSVRNSEA